VIDYSNNVTDNVTLSSVTLSREKDVVSNKTALKLSLQVPSGLYATLSKPPCITMGFCIFRGYIAREITPSFPGGDAA
jgi:hypothetical protein